MSSSVRSVVEKQPRRGGAGSVPADAEFDGGEADPGLAGDLGLAEFLFAGGAEVFVAEAAGFGELVRVRDGWFVATPVSAEKVARFILTGETEA
jgi:hypothetical protein